MDPLMQLDMTTASLNNIEEEAIAHKHTTSFVAIHKVNNLPLVHKKFWTEWFWKSHQLIFIFRVFPLDCNWIIDNGSQYYQ